MIQRYTSLRAVSIKDHYAKEAKAAERRRKRMAKRRELGLGPDRTTVKARLDHLHSLAIRRRDRKVHGGLCLVCMAKARMGIMNYPPQPIELAYHIVPRGDENTRWRMDNAVGACSRCNYGELHSRERESTKALYRSIHIVLLGSEAKLLELERLSRLHSDLSTAALLVMCETMKKIVEGRA